MDETSSNSGGPNPDEFPEGSIEAEAHLERLVRLGFPFLAKEYAAKKDLLDALNRLERGAAEPPDEGVVRSRPQVLSLVGGLVLIWIGSSILLKNLVLLVLSGEIDFVRMARLLAGVAALLVAWVLLGAMTKLSLDRFRRTLRIGIPLVCLVGLATALLF